ncbi:Hypothetical protein HVPorG_03214 [Roseomonas mucosa]|uniref:hypothetical protein n=1 Tax=Roseomonas mucosa TaxID=207340 RepID=UPI0022096053|nr:hypothetical protein [Roseomonas mucosa]QDJ09890.1 Hypothetical protein HVPorG_03214 [Roseomonas mucosa]
MFATILDGSARRLLRPLLLLGFLVASPQAVSGAGLVPPSCAMSQLLAVDQDRAAPSPTCYGGRAVVRFGWTLVDYGLATMKYVIGLFLVILGFLFLMLGYVLSFLDFLLCWR